MQPPNKRLKLAGSRPGAGAAGLGYLAAAYVGSQLKRDSLGGALSAKNE